MRDTVNRRPAGITKTNRWRALLAIVCCALCIAWAPRALAAPLYFGQNGLLEYQVDEDGSKTLADAQAHGDWRTLRTANELDLYGKRWYWFRIKIPAASMQRELILALQYPRMEELDVTIEIDGELPQTIRTGMHQKTAPVLLRDRWPLFPLQLATGQSATVYLHTAGRSRLMATDLVLWDSLELLRHIPERELISSAYLSPLVAVALIVTVLGLTLRRREYLWFGAYLSALFTRTFVYEGYGQMFIWPGQPLLEGKVIAVLGLLTPMLFGCFAAAFLRLKQFHPAIYKLNAAVIGWNLAMCAVVGLAFHHVVGSLVGFAILPEPFLYGALWYASYMQWRKKLQPLAGWYCLLWSIQIAANMVPIVIALLGFAKPLLPYTFELVGAIHVAALTAAVTLHMRHLMQQDQLARAQAKTKGEFLARMSHEIRTPMNGILGMSELLRDGPLSPTQRQYNEIIYSSASSLLTIINDILDFSKIESGKLQLEKIPFDLRRLTTDSLALLRPLVEQKDIELLCDISPDTPAWVLGDPTRIRQILINYLSNAVKFTDRGEICLRVNTCANNHIRFSVNDTGCGVPLDAETRLFNSFEQADNSISRKYGGTGLGLAICKQLAELMHGSVGINNRAGGGATFWVQLPLTPSPSSDLLDDAINCRDWVNALPRSALQVANEQPTLNILVVEDNVTNQVVVRAMLERLGHRVTLVDNGRDGITTALAQHNALDLVLMDCEMPVLSGKEATRQIRLEEQRRNLPRLPIFALTAATLPEQILACAAAGMDGHFAKPISMLELRNLLATVIAARAADEILVPA